MSEYQYYEFITLDRPLTKAQMAELRQLSTRAEISATRFTNVYHFGSFRGDPAAMMRKYFDAMVYVTNWGTHEFMVRLPKAAIDPAVVREYLVPHCFALETYGEHVVLAYDGSAEDSDNEWDDGEDWMPRLAQVRAELMRGDARPLYLGWLLGIINEEWEDDVLEPPIPPGLTALPSSLAELARYLRLDVDLLAAAAEASPAPDAETAGLAAWVAALPVAEKDRLLTRVAAGNSASVAAELVRRFRAVANAMNASGGDPARRTVGAIRVAAERQAAIRKAEEARRAAVERARRETEAAAHLAKRLDGLARRGEAAWRDVEQQIDRKQAQAYADAVRQLRDLRALAERDHTQRDFQTRLDALRERHVKKRGLIEQLDAVALR